MSSFNYNNAFRSKNHNEYTVNPRHQEIINKKLAAQRAANNEAQRVLNKYNENENEAKKVEQRALNKYNENKAKKVEQHKSVMRSEANFNVKEQKSLSNMASNIYQRMPSIGINIFRKGFLGQNPRSLQTKESSSNRNSTATTASNMSSRRSNQTAYSPPIKSTLDRMMEQELANPEIMLNKSDLNRIVNVLKETSKKSGEELSINQNQLTTIIHAYSNNTIKPNYATALKNGLTRMKYGLISKNQIVNLTKKITNLNSLNSQYYQIRPAGVTSKNLNKPRYSI